MGLIKLAILVGAGIYAVKKIEKRKAKHLREQQQQHQQVSTSGNAAYCTLCTHCNHLDAHSYNKNQTQDHENPYPPDETSYHPAAEKRHMHGEGEGESKSPFQFQFQAQSRAPALALDDHRSTRHEYEDEDGYEDGHENEKQPLYLDNNPYSPLPQSHSHSHKYSYKGEEDVDMDMYAHAHAQAYAPRGPEGRAAPPPPPPAYSGLRKQSESGRVEGYDGPEQSSVQRGRSKSAALLDTLAQRVMGPARR